MYTQRRADWQETAAFIYGKPGSVFTRWPAAASSLLAETLVCFSRDVSSSLLFRYSSTFFCLKKTNASVAPCLNLWRKISLLVQNHSFEFLDTKHPFTRSRLINHRRPATGGKSLADTVRWSTTRTHFSSASSLFLNGASVHVKSRRGTRSRSSIKTDRSTF